MRLDRSRSFKVIDFCTNRKPEYDLLLVISYDLSSISPRVRDIVLRIKLKPPIQVLAPIEETLIHFVVKSIKRNVETFRYFLVKPT